MGRPRVLRSAAEQAAFDEKRRQRRREQARARRADPAFKAAQAQARLQRQAADPTLKARLTEAQRQRRATNPEARERNTQLQRQRRAANPELRERDAQVKRQRRAAHPDVRDRDIEAKRQRRAADPEFRAREAERLRQRRAGASTSAYTSNADPAAPKTARCVVPICHSRSAPSSILYPLPAELSQRQAWIDFVRGCPCGGARDWNPPSNEISLVCSLHFSVRCFRFQRPRGYSVGYSKCLRRDAVPTLYPIEEQCSSVPNENFPDDTAERLVSSGVEDAAGRTPNSLASSRSVAVVQRLSHRLASLLPGQDRGHCASDQDTARRLAHLAAFELTFLKNVSTQCSVEMASKAASCAVRTVSKSVQCSG
ncbi:uncharacterized protein LOC119453846 isoform X9 [Dermacentor silvarum]|uniref:uncharacterized protein LOC119453846 isoform X9 n=1 Tax=Dermacentor silvarum TaxID=543639 RepID=UPI00210082E3|nr:uncharacterized protein LOC119453846 isoform X9 [Dermacentor silvarum]